jgi:hypothetical protein
MTITLRNSTETVTTGSTTTRAINKPTNTADGDLMVAGIYTSNTSGDNSITTLSGWDLRFAQQFPDSKRNLNVYTRTAASEGSSYTWTFATSTPSRLMMASYYSTNGWPITFDVCVKQNKSTGDVSFSTPTLADWYEMLIVWFANAAVGTYTAPGASVQEQIATAGNAMSMIMCDLLRGRVTTSGTTVATTPDNTQTSAGVMIAIKETPSKILVIQ